MNPHRLGPLSVSGVLLVRSVLWRRPNVLTRVLLRNVIGTSIYQPLFSGPHFILVVLVLTHCGDLDASD